MNQNFGTALEMLLHHEGGFVNHEKDPGGATNLGVTKRVWEAWVGYKVTIDDMKALTKADVAPLYHERYWKAISADNLPSGVDVFLFDWAVNSGPKRVAKALQKAVGAKQDGAIGPMTLAAVNAANPKKLVTDVFKTRQSYYEKLKNFKYFGRGWTRRNKEMKAAALKLV